MENKKSKYIFMVLAGLCVMMIILSSVKDGIMNPIRNTIGYVLVPFQSGVNSVGFGIYENLKEHRTLAEVEEENKRLSEKIGLLTEQNNRLTQDSGELQRLRELYELDQNYMQYEKIAARVIAKDSENWFQVFRIDKGSKDGIRVDQNVMANGGLIGIVTDVGLNYATVRSIIDDESRVSAMGIQASDTCIVAGDLTLYEQGRLRITDMKKNASIQDGDRIVTSSISAKFMPGILIGYAVDVEEDDQRLMKNGYLIPAADFDDLSEVLVIKAVKSDSFKDENSGDEIASETEAYDSIAASSSNIASTWAGMEGLTPLSEIVGNQGTDSSEDFPVSASDIADDKRIELSQSTDDAGGSDDSTGGSAREDNAADDEDTPRETAAGDDAARDDADQSVETIAGDGADDTSSRGIDAASPENGTDDTDELIEENPN